jgi:hypothetical protein
MANKKTAVKTETETQSWDDFWSEVNAKSTTEVIRGVTVTVPTDLPLGFQQRMTALQYSERDEDVQELVSMIFGPGVLDKWLDTGMGSREFKVILMWGMSNGGGKAISFREAYDMLLVAEAEGKAFGRPNRAARRAATRSPSSATGGQSKRTSNASTTLDIAT